MQEENTNSIENPEYPEEEASRQDLETVRKSLREIRREPDDDFDYERQIRTIEDQEEIEGIQEELGIKPEEPEFTPEQERMLDEITEKIMAEDTESGQESAREDFDENTRDFSEKSLDFLLGEEMREELAKDPELAKAVKAGDVLRPELEEFIKSRGEQAKERVGKERVEKFQSTLADRLPEEARSAIEDEMGKSSIDWSKVRSVLYQAADFVPFVGGVKMATECLVGKTLDGRELQGWRRAMHGVEGVAFTTLDFTGIGGVAARGAKGSAMTVRALRRSAAAARKLGAQRRVYSAVWKTASMIERNPLLYKAIDKQFGKFKRLRKKELLGTITDQETKTKAT